MSKIISGSPNFQAVGRGRTGKTAFASRVGGSHLMRAGFPYLIPADSVFYAPLRDNTREFVNQLTPNYARSLDATYESSSGQWRRAQPNQARFESGYLLMEAAATNQCENYNANPDAALTGLSLSGDPACVIRRVLDVDRLARAGLSDICTSGYVVEVDNSAGSSFAQCVIGGFVSAADTNHSLSAFGARMTPAGLVRVQYANGQAASPSFTTSEYVRHHAIGGNTVSNAQITFYVSAGAIGRFVLNGLVTEETLSTPIVVEGASASRGNDTLFYSGFGDVLNQTEGMLIFDWFHRGDDSVYAVTFYQDGKLTFFPSITGPARYVSSSDGTQRLQTLDGTNTHNFTLTAPIFNNNNKVCIRWNGAIVEQGVKRNSESWSWGGELAYDGDWNTNNELHVGYNTIFPWRCKDVTVWDEDKGRAWVENRY